MYAPRTELGLVVRGVTLLLVLCGGLEPVWTRIFHNSISVTHHSSLKIPCLFGTITHFPSLNIFHTICGPSVIGATFSFSFLVPK